MYGLRPQMPPSAHIDQRDEQSIGVVGQLPYNVSIQTRVRSLTGATFSDGQASQCLPLSFRIQAERLMHGSIIDPRSIRLVGCSVA
jgi:hypothetical protein